MLLIIEKIDDVRFIIENKDDPAKKRLFIEGVFLQGGIKNRNGRIYPPETLEREVQRYINEKVNTNRAAGELGHPEGPTINLDRVSHRIVKLTREGTNYVGKALIASTPMGQIAQKLIEDGFNLGVSSRGMGSLKENNGIMEVQEDFHLATAADIVADPSAPDAFVSGIMEGVQWWYDIASGTWQKEKLHETKKQLKSMTLQEISEQKIAMFEQFCASLLRKRQA